MARLEGVLLKATRLVEMLPLRSPEMKDEPNESTRSELTTLEVDTESEAEIQPKQKFGIQSDKQANVTMLKSRMPELTIDTGSDKSWSSASGDEYPFTPPSGSSSESEEPNIDEYFEGLRNDEGEEWRKRGRRENTLY